MIEKRMKENNKNMAGNKSTSSKVSKIIFHAFMIHVTNSASINLQSVVHLNIQL